MSTELAVDPPSIRFSVSQEAELEEALRRTDRTTDVVTIEKPEDLTLRHDGSNGLGLKLTTWGLYQISRSICVGLYRVLTELTATGDEQAKLVALSMFNQTIRLRFGECLAGQNLLVDRSTGLIEAMVSPRYRFLSNLSLYERAGSSMSSLPGTRFYEATLNGRWFLLRYYQSPAMFETVESRYHAGFHFSNHEGGQASLRAANTVVRAKGMLAVLTPFTRDKHVRHAGLKFDKKLGKLMDTVAQHSWNVGLIKTGVEEASKQKLGLSPTDEKTTHDLMSHLARRGEIHAALAAKIIAGAVVQPHSASKPLPSAAVGREEMAARTTLDLIVAACREGYHCSINLREQVEQLAYGLLTGRCRIK